MADPSAQEAAAKELIISHMNEDHHDSLVLYLEHLKAVSSYTANTACLSDISFEAMSISAGGKFYRIPLVPPLLSWDVRVAAKQLEAMDKEARQALARSDISVKQYTPPRGQHLFIFTLVAFSLFVLSLPDTYIRRIFHFVPGVARFIVAVRPFLLPLVLGLHTLESYALARKLRAHNVPFMSGLWLKWQASCLVEGLGALQRVDTLVEKGRVQREKGKH